MAMKYTHLSSSIHLSQSATCGDPSSLLGGDGLSSLVEHPSGILVRLQLGEGYSDDS